MDPIPHGDTARGCGGRRGRGVAWQDGPSALLLLVNKFSRALVDGGQQEEGGEGNQQRLSLGQGQT